MNNDEIPALNFEQSIEANLRWIKSLASKHDCSQGLVATATLMTMTMMDHHKVNQIMAEINSSLERIESHVCPSNS